MKVVLCYLCIFSAALWGYDRPKNTKLQK